MVVDNTFATPCFQQPFELGADIVVHSVTKYLAGHSDTVQGAVLAKDPAVFEPIKFLQNATGAVPSPFDCWLTMRGLKTLELRMQRHEENAAAIAKALSMTTRSCRRFISPGCRAHPGHEIARQQMTRFRRHGFVRAGRHDGRGDRVRFLAPLFRARRKPGRREGADLPSRHDDARVDPTLKSARNWASPIALLRLSPGCENAEDLVEDLLEGLERVGNARAIAKASQRVAASNR